MQIVEIFKSIQGEGILIGMPMVFIRLWGCNMQCIWCDTTYSWSPEFKEITKRTSNSPKELVNYLIKAYPEVTWFNFTGGEPTLWEEEILQSTILLHSYSKKVCIQTNGKEWKEELFTSLDKVCMDIKCPNSGEKSDLESIKRLRNQDELKFVVESDIDLEFTKKVIKDYPSKAHIIIQPVLLKDDLFEQYYERIRWLIHEFEPYGFENLRILPQMHQLLWRDEPGK